MKHILDIQKSEGKKGRVYITFGSNGSCVMDSDGVLYFQKTSGEIEGPTKKTTVTDLNGAGDTFCGVMTLLEAENKYSILEVLDYSNAAAQICVKYPGANKEDIINVDKMKEFREQHRKDIWKYNTTTRQFENFVTPNFNLKKS